MATNKLKAQIAADNDAAALGYLRKSDLFHKAEIQMLVTLAEAYGIKMTFNEKDGEVTVERVNPPKENAQTEQSFAQMQRTPTQSSPQQAIDYDKLASALKEHVAKALQNAVESSPVHTKALFDKSVHMDNNQAVMTLAREEWAKWVKTIGKETISRLTNASVPVHTPQGKVLTFGEDSVYKFSEEELGFAPKYPSGATGKQPRKHHRLRQLWSHIWSDMVASWWKCFAYTVALCCLILAAVAWYKQWQLEDVVKEYYIIKPVLKQDRKYATLIHTMDSVILEDGIDEVCERLYREKQK